MYLNLAYSGKNSQGVKAIRAKSNCIINKKQIYLDKREIESSYQKYLSPNSNMSTSGYMKPTLD
mgnify:CR=1 FL=1